MINFNLVEPKIYVGSAPLDSDDIERLQQMGVTAVISLQSDDDLISRKINWNEFQRLYQSHDILVKRFPINDFDEKDLSVKVVEPIKALNELLERGSHVYVHCNAGICRAPSVVLGYLCQYQSMDIESGLRRIRAARSVANPFLGAIEKALLELTEQS